jgi:CheY-like chemotaxis protein
MNKGEVELVLVEDNKGDAELITRVLKKHSLANRIVLLKDGAEALDFLFGQGRDARGDVPIAPRLVLLDIKLPKVDGIEVLRRMKSDERTREIPVVMLTSSNEERDVSAAYELGCNSFVTKPIRFAEFAEVVAKLGIYWIMVNVPPVREG